MRCDFCLKTMDVLWDEAMGKEYYCTICQKTVIKKYDRGLGDEGTDETETAKTVS